MLIKKADIHKKMILLKLFTQPLYTSYQLFSEEIKIYIYFVGHRYLVIKFTF